MDDLQGKLSEILGDEDSMRRVRELAQQLLGSQGEDAPTPTAPTAPALFDDGIDIQKILQIVSRLKSHGEDDRTKLLIALKPNLSSARAQRVDTAVKLLKVIDLLPLLRETDLFSMF